MNQVALQRSHVSVPLRFCLGTSESDSQVTAAYCHFGREPYTENGIKYFEWENAKDLSKFGTMTSENVSAALASSNFLQKWVD